GVLLGRNPDSAFESQVVRTLGRERDFVAPVFAHEYRVLQLVVVGEAAAFGNGRDKVFAQNILPVRVEVEVLKVRAQHLA
nr:hypothetical protein [Tanacetum cinerariifolium]